MKKLIILVFGIGLIVSLGYSVEIDVGLSFGGRTVSDENIGDVYGSGIVYFPYISMNVWKGFWIGMGYEGGYSRDGKIGIYEEPATLKISGFDLFLSHRFKIKKWRPFVKLGYGFYSYKQLVDSSFVEDIDENKSGFSLAGGCFLSIRKGFYAGIELKYVPLKVAPIDIEVDLGGLRYMVIFGYTFGYQK